MPQLINNGVITENDWQLLAKDEQLPAISQDQKYLVHVKKWLKNKDALLGNKFVGVWLDSDDDAETLAEYINDVSVIAINFPVFSDGRGYSIARRLKEKFGYEGELRAVGDVLKDQIFFYQRTGFTSYLVREDRSAEVAVESTNDFTAVYQSAADGRAPVLRKR